MRLPGPTAAPDVLFSQSLAKGLQLLCAFQAGQRSLTLGGIAPRTGMPKASAQRSNHTLQRLGDSDETATLTEPNGEAQVLTPMGTQVPM